MPFTAVTRVEVVLATAGGGDEVVVPVDDVALAVDEVVVAALEVLLEVLLGVELVLPAALALAAAAAAGAPLASDPLAPQADKTTQHATRGALRPKEKNINRPENIMKVAAF